jgi:SAM-dependent methyltransferase
MTAALLDVIACPRCGGPLAGAPSGFRCGACALVYPVRDGVPRFVGEVDDPVARRTQASFGYEWTHFSDWQPSGAINFQDYFDGLDLGRLAGARVLDGGCGMGRHARQFARHGGDVVAVDFSDAVEAARQNLAGCGNVDCVQADLFHLPLAPGTFDFVYSMGVVHHVADTDLAVRCLARCLKPGGRMRVYLYWAHTGWKGALLRLVAAARRITTRLPHPLLRALCLVLSAGLWLAVVLPLRACRAFGADVSSAPLFVYTRYPFRVLYNDQFDRFSAPLEKRYSRDEAGAVLARAGLEQVRVTPRFGWLVDGIRPAGGAD